MLRAQRRLEGIDGSEEIHENEAELHEFADKLNVPVEKLHVVEGVGEEDFEDVVEFVNVDLDDEEFYDMEREEIYEDAVDGLDGELDAEEDMDLFACCDLDAGAVQSSAAPVKEMIEITADSGAGEAVADPKSFPGCHVSPSKGSVAGQRFLGAGGEVIHNEGKFQVAHLTEFGAIGKMTFQAARVRKPLMAVSSINRRGNLVLFDGDRSFILPGNAPEVAQVRKNVDQIRGKVPLHLRNGVFTMKTWRQAAPFPGQGA